MNHPSPSRSVPSRRSVLEEGPPLRLAAAQAAPLLEAAVHDHPDDLPARESLAYSLGMLDRLAEARHAYEEVLQVEPRRETPLPYLARTLSGLRLPDLAGAALREVIAVNPWRSDYRLALARTCSESGDWPGAVAACREAIRLNPELFEARSLLIQGYLDSAEPAKADAEFQILLKYFPASRDLWRQWYEGQKQAGLGNASHATKSRP